MGPIPVACYYKTTSHGGTKPGVPLPPCGDCAPDFFTLKNWHTAPAPFHDTCGLRRCCAKIESENLL